MAEFPANRPAPRLTALRVVADDLSGAAECAAALAAASGAPVPLTLSAQLARGGSHVVDTDARALPVAQAADISVQASRGAASGGPGVQVYKKIDSTLRGHLVAELQAVLAVPDLFQAAVVCPTLPDQGRALREGVLHVHGVPQRDAAGRPLDLRRMLCEGGLPALHLPRTPAPPRELACLLGSAISAQQRVLVVDAEDAADLQRLAAALLLLPPMRVLAAGSAGLLKALAGPILGPLRAGAPSVLRAQEAPVAVLVGSFSPVSREQVEALAEDARVTPVCLPASAWLAGDADPALQAALRDADQAFARGNDLVFALSEVPSGTASRALVQAMAAAAAPLLQRAGTLVLTGGDTARTVLDQLGARRLEVFGEFEPGICISRPAGVEAPFLVTKAGGFGDRGSLLRAVRHFRKNPA